jgi:hypothetical protein
MVRESAPAGGARRAPRAARQNNQRANSSHSGRPGVTGDEGDGTKRPRLRPFADPVLRNDRVDHEDVDRRLLMPE